MIWSVQREQCLNDSEGTFRIYCHGAVPRIDVGLKFAWQSGVLDRLAYGEHQYFHCAGQEVHAADNQTRCVPVPYQQHLFDGLMLSYNGGWFTASS